MSDIDYLRLLWCETLQGDIDRSLFFLQVILGAFILLLFICYQLPIGILQSSSSVINGSGWAVTNVKKLPLLTYLTFGLFTLFVGTFIIQIIYATSN